MFRIVIKRCEKDNVLTGRARYRVVALWPATDSLSRRVHSLGEDYWLITLPKPRQINSFINPAKAMFPPNMKGVKA